VPDPFTHFALITGGNSGIGFATVNRLAGLGYHVILAARNPQASSTAISRLQVAHPNAILESIPLDLTSFASIRQCVDTFHAKGYPLHLLINHAGAVIYGKQASFTSDSFEKTFQTNYLGHFLLTQLLLEDLKSSAPARIINVTSQLHIPGYGRGPYTDFDYDNLKGEKYYHPQVFYKNTKLAIVWFTYELQRRLEGSGVTANAVCPGFVPASMAERTKSPIQRFFYRHIMPLMPFARSLEQASGSFVYVATNPRYSSVGGKFIVDYKEIPSSEESYDQAKARQLWEQSLSWCSLK
jgi:NAD(P)-dependent dehydrogenase (short-subunit alcohol dehydrogenase family)